MSEPFLTDAIKLVREQWENEADYDSRTDFIREWRDLIEKHTGVNPVTAEQGVRDALAERQTEEAALFLFAVFTRSRHDMKRAKQSWDLVLDEGQQEAWRRVAREMFGRLTSVGKTA